MQNDRHENSKWEFRQAKDNGDGTFRRLYRSRQTPNIFKRVSKRRGCQSHEWEAVSYTDGTAKDRFGKLTWVGKLADVPHIPAMIASMEKNYAQLEASGVTWTAEAFAA